MYCCTDCKKTFFNPRECYETHGLKTPPFERHLVCPYCKGSVVPVEVAHCRYCGARLPEGATEYCNNACRHRGEILWRREARRRKLLHDNPISQLIRMVEQYNREHKTNYSYGQYVALILPQGC